MHCDAIEDWAEMHPEIKSKFEERIRNVPEANREGRSSTPRGRRP